ncbi:hypothetical protein D9757_004788 [Collybiopsis confluens]|uniref:ERCC4 domain-containing protein n=1 Tax=Collybiopsis confluens TaxID=2823264 RepID=A0A8H5MCB6_9AGAR|nr:hypothetical protein D9757_004788 [Collybiopsis confluens]
MSALLPYHTSILNEIYDPATSDLLVIARGLGLRRIICTLLKIVDSPQNLVLLVNATQEEETDIGEELGLMGCRKPGLRIVGYETGTSRDRQDLYKKGGLFSVTSRILVVDMLQNTVPIDMITGIMVLHAEKVSPLHLVSFITRLYREKNDKGFLKAFTDQPEHITSGLSPLKNVMKELQLRRVSVYPRFHQEVKDALEKKRADVIELAQHLTVNMNDIHGAIVQCMNSTLAELRRSKVDLELDSLNLPAAYFSSFDHLVRKQLDPIWHKVGPTTKALVRDIGVLRRLVNYLLVYDPLQFHSYCQSLIEAAIAPATAGSNVGSGKSQWMLTDAANIIFQAAKARCFVDVLPDSQATSVMAGIESEDEEGWDAVYQSEGRPAPSNKPGRRPKWIPKEMEPVLEELPKWSLLAEILEEVEGEIVRMESTVFSKPVEEPPGTNITLVMCSSTATCTLLNDFLSLKDDKRPKGEWGRRMMLKKLRSWLWWEKRQKERMDAEASGKKGASGHDLGEMRWRSENPEDEGLSEALKKKDRERAAQKASRRRGFNCTRETPAPGDIPQLNFDGLDPELLALNDEELELNLIGNNPDMSTLEFTTEFDAHYGLLLPAQTLLIRAYSDDTDDRMLDEIKPRFIVMFEPCMEFVRRVEVYKCSNPGLPVRVYHMVYANSIEEHKYLAGIRREKDAFERLIKERGSMLLPILEDRHSSESDAIIKTISTRIAGGRRELNKVSSQVIVDMREFRSTLPSLLHASQLLVVPATLTIGDYILTPEICVERKSLSDLVSSFNSGRLYTQCELMSVHYKTPVLLIEFEEDKAFSLEIVSDLKSYAKPINNRYPPKKKPTGNPAEHTTYNSPTIQSKIALLVLSFPRLRIIWSSSPYATTDIFNDLKRDRAEPDPVKAISMGAEDENAGEVGAGINATAEELLRTFPGITEKNVKHVMSKVRNVRELCEMNLLQIQGVLGAEPGKSCYDFLHKGEGVVQRHGAPTVNK